MSGGVLEKVRRLVERAAHPGTPRHEAETAAIEACRRIHEHDLLGARAAEKTAEPPRSVVMRSVFVLVFEFSDAYMFVRYRSSLRTSGIPQHEGVRFPKDQVRRVRWIETEEEELAAGVQRGHGWRLASEIEVDASFLERPPHR